MVTDGNLKAVQALGVGLSVDISTGPFPVSERRRVVRVYAKTDVRLWMYVDADKMGDGLLMPAGAVEYFSLYGDMSLFVDGSANVSEMVL